MAAAIINYYDSDAPSQASLMQDPEFGLGAGNPKKILEKYGNFTKEVLLKDKKPAAVMDLIKKSIRNQVSMCRPVAANWMVSNSGAGLHSMVIEGYDEPFSGGNDDGTDFELLLRDPAYGPSEYRQQRRISLRAALTGKGNDRMVFYEYDPNEYQLAGLVFSQPPMSRRKP